MYETIHRRNICATSRKRKIQMLPCVMQPFGNLLVFTWILVISHFLPVRAQAQQQQFSSNPDDYDFGWFATGIHAPGSVPYCTYCVHALDNTSYAAAADQATYGQYWNRTVGLYRCDGVQTNEMWAYQESTNSIVFSNVTSSVLCIDALLWDSIGVLKLRPCNSSLATQRWITEGNRVISGWSDSNGQPLQMVGETPNKGTNPSNQEDTYPLVINSSIPNDVGYSSTANFSFLTRQNLVNRSTNRFTTQGLLQINNSSRDQLVNGGFECSTIQAGTDIAWSTWQQNEPSYLALCGWVIDYGPVDYMKSGFLEAANGSMYSVHLNTHTDVDHCGSISQTFLTEPGREYHLSFWGNGFPPKFQIPSRPSWQCSADYNEARLQVGVTNATSTDMVSRALSDENGFTHNFTFNATSSNSLNFGKLWELQVVIFTASTNVSTISFSSLNVNDSCGPMIDEVTLSRLESEQESGSQAKGQIVLIVVGSIALLAIVITVPSVVYGIRYCRRVHDIRNCSGMYKTEQTRVYSAKELSLATKKFSSVLGEGGFGTVYKAEFPDGTVGAVKVEKQKGVNSSSQVLASDEIAVLLRVHHRNLVNLIGFCIDKGRHMLVFEYLPNGSLYDRLHQSILHSSLTTLMHSVEPGRPCSVLSWKQRVKIAADVACGLDYLHNDANPPIVHRDVKSQNILLTATDSAKLADFGLSKAAPVSATYFQSIETIVRGSIGYLDPQYFLTGVFSAKSDVYSFGVVLLELISGHPAIYNAAPLASWAAPYMSSPSAYHEVVDKKLNGEFDGNELESLIELSKMCTLEDIKLRPNMRQVVAFLNSKNLATIAQGRSEWMEDSKARVAYHKMKPKFINLESLPREASNTNNFCTMSGPQPRD